MGCISSKLLTKSKSFQEELNQRLHRSSTGLEELFTSKNGGDQLLALLYTANTLGKAPKTASVSEESETIPIMSIEHTASNLSDSKRCETIVKSPFELTEIEIINTWELLDGLEEEKEGEGNHKEQIVKGSCISTTEEHKSRASEDFTISCNFNSMLTMNDDIGVSIRSFRTVEDYDALVAAKNSQEEMKHVIGSTKNREVQLLGEPGGSTKKSLTILLGANHQNKPVEEDKEAKLHSIDTTTMYKETDQLENKITSKKGLKRINMAKDLPVLDVPKFDFPRIGSLKDWLRGEAQVNSPGYYMTPKFGHPPEKLGVHHTVFDPEMIAQFEQAMMQLTADEEFILQQIVEGSEEDVTRMEMLQDQIQAEDRVAKDGDASNVYEKN